MRLRGRSRLRSLMSSMSRKKPDNEQARGARGHIHWNTCRGATNGAPRIRNCAPCAAGSHRTRTWNCAASWMCRRPCSTLSTCHAGGVPCARWKRPCRTRLRVSTGRARICASSCPARSGMTWANRMRPPCGSPCSTWNRNRDASWRAVAARDLYEAGYAPAGAPEPLVQHLQPFEHVVGPWNDVYARLVGDA